MKVFLFLILGLSISCKSHEKAAMAANDDSIQEELTLLLSDNYGGTATTEIQVIRDTKSLIKFFAEINKTRKPGLPLPEIDFNKEMVLVYCHGITQLKTVPGLFVKAETDQEKILGIMEAENKTATTDSAIKVPFSLYKLPLTDKQFVLRPNE